MPATLEAAPARVRLARDRLYTGKDLLNHPEWGPCELIRGKVIRMCRPNFLHGKLMGEMTQQIGPFVKKNKLGTIVVGDSGVYLERDPDTVCGPDIYFISTKREPSKELESGYLEVAPELCIEIVSPKDRWSKLQTKVDMYLAIGVKLVWVIDPAKRKVHIFRADKTTEALKESDTLSGESILPGLKLPLKDLFAVLD